MMFLGIGSGRVSTTGNIFYGRPFAQSLELDANSPFLSMIEEN